jgi:predicted acetyltransferase
MKTSQPTYRLKEIEQFDGNDVYEMFQELPRYELGSENIANGMTLKQFETYKKKLVDNSRGLNLKKNETQKINYVFYKDKKPIGSIALRLKLNEYWRKHSGHIGFSIRPTEREKHYGTKMLALALKNAKELGMKKMYLQCNNKNIASQKVIENNGGIRIKENASIYYYIQL